MKTRWFLSVLLMSFAATASAGPLNLDQVSADARWIAHLDVDTLWASQTGSELLKPLFDTTRAKTEMKKLRDATGFDLRDGLHGITLYGHEFKPRCGVILVSADARVTTIVEFLAKQPDYQTNKYHGRTVYSWTDRLHGNHRVLASIYGPVGRTSLIVIAHQRKELEQALDVLEGKAPRFSQSGSPLVAEGKQLAENRPLIITLGASGLADVKLPFRSPVVRQCDRFLLEIGETKGEAFMAAQLTAKTDESAAEMGRVVDGLLAMGRLAGDTNEELNTILDDVKLSVDGKTVTLKWHGQVTDVVRVVITFAQEHKNKSKNK